MIEFPKTLAALVELAPGRALRAGGTDLQERRALHLSEGPLVDLRDLAGLDAIEVDAAGLRLGARAKIAALARHAELARVAPGLAEAAGVLATPQIRNVATLGGNLLQEVRCWYYRRPGASCFRAGGGGCPARAGDHLYHACFDLGPCVAPHPSTLATALLAYEAQVELGDGQVWPVEALYGDGSDAARTHRLPAGAVLAFARVPTPPPGERAAYVRATSRARAEWPLVEVVARLAVQGGTIAAARVAVGGVATVPLRRARVEERLVGRVPDEATLREAAALAGEGARPLPGTGYKLELLSAAVYDALERARLGLSPWTPSASE